MTNRDEPATAITSDFHHTLELLRAARDGERAALEALFERYRDRVLEIVRIRLGPRLRQAVESTDLAQEAMLQAFRSFDRFERGGNAEFLRWLSRIVTNTIRREARSLSTQRRDRERETRLEADPPEARGSAGTPSGGAAAAERREIVNDCLAELSERHREIILLRDYVGVPWSDLVGELGLASKGAAHMLYARATQALGRRLRSRGVK